MKRSCWDAASVFSAAVPLAERFCSTGLLIGVVDEIAMAGLLEFIDPFAVF
jgi:hypothetical protein